MSPKLDDVDEFDISKETLYVGDPDESEDEDEEEDKDKALLEALFSDSSDPSADDSLDEEIDSALSDESPTQRLWEFPDESLNVQSFEHQETRKPKVSRRAFASDARRSMDVSHEESYGLGYESGYVQALKDMGVEGDTLWDAYGGLVKKGIQGAGGIFSSAARGFLGTTPKEAAKELRGEVGKELQGQIRKQLGVAGKPTQMAEELGKQLRQQALGVVEADESTLPPVYVEDKEGFEEDLALDEGSEPIELDDSLLVQEEFGATAKHGFFASQPRHRIREAAKKAMIGGQASLKTATPSGPAPFVEDPEAAPKLYSTGRIVDAVYGEMSLVPCPSCSRIPEKFAGMGKAENCLVCTQYGAILIPKSDISHYVASTSYGILPLLVAAVSSATPKIMEQASKGKLFPKAMAKLKTWLSGKKAKTEALPSDSSIDLDLDKESEEESETDPYDISGVEEMFGGVEEEPEEDVEEQDLPEEYGVVRALVPSRYRFNR